MSKQKIEKKFMGFWVEPSFAKQLKLAAIKNDMKIGEFCRKYLEAAIQYSEQRYSIQRFPLNKGKQKTAEELLEEMGKQELNAIQE